MGTTHPLTRLRAEADFSALDLENASGVDRKTIYAIEQGRTTRPRPRTIARLARALGCSFEEIEAAVEPREDDAA